MTDSQQQQTDAFDMSEIMALAANKFGGVEFQNDSTAKEEEENAPPAVQTEAPSGTVVEEKNVSDKQAAGTENTSGDTQQTEPPAEKQEPAAEVKAPEIDPMLKAMLELNQPKVEEKTEPAAESQPEVKAEPVKTEQPAQPPQQARVLTPNDVIDDATRQLLVEYRDLDEQSFSVMDQVAAAHAKAGLLNLENAFVGVVQQLHQQLAQQTQIIAQLQSQLSGVNTRITAPTLDQDIDAMKADPAVAAYLPYMQNVLNGNDSNAKMQLVNTWKQSKSQAPAVAPVTQAPVIERRTSNVSAAAEATAALANKTQSSMVQPQDEIKEGMDLAAARFGPNR